MTHDFKGLGLGFREEPRDGFTSALRKKGTSKALEMYA